MSFATLAGTHLQHPKRTWNGLMERRRLLAAAGIELPADLPGCDAGADDVLDAAAVAWTAARKARGRGADAPRRAAVHGRPAGCDLVLMQGPDSCVSRVPGAPGAGMPPVHQSSTRLEHSLRDRSDRWSM